MARERLLIIEDEEDIQELIKVNLSGEGYSCLCADSGEEGLNKAVSDLPELILLDLMLPGMDGLDVCRQLKQNSRTQHIPIIMLTAKGEESDIVTGLELGAADYMTKPFSPKVLIARVRAVMRRVQGPTTSGQAPLRIRELTIDPGRHEVTYNSKPIPLTATEFQVLHLLARKPGWVFTRQQIVDNVKGEDYAVTERAVDVQIVGLRKKLGDAAEYIDTVRGVGYRFKEDS